MKTLFPVNDCWDCSEPNWQDWGAANREAIVRFIANWRIGVCKIAH
jgi:hypothetical protein